MMHTLFNTLSIFAYIALIFLPIILFQGLKNVKRHTSFIYYVGSIILSILIVGVGDWCSQYSDVLLMEEFGYDFNASTMIESYKMVAPENIEKVKRLDYGQDSGDWNMRLALFFIMYIPYLIIIRLLSLVYTQSEYKKLKF